MPDLIKHQKILGKIYTVVGDDGTDIILNSKGNVKVRFGDSFINLLKNGKVSSDALSSSGSKLNIISVSTKSEITSNGIYYNKEDGEFYLYLDGILFKLSTEEVQDDEVSNNPSDYTKDKYLSITEYQKLTEEQLQIVLSNLKLIIEYLTDNINDIPEGYPVFVTSEGKHYRKNNDNLEELYLHLETGGTVKGNVTIGTGSLDNYTKSKLNIISNSPLTLYDGKNNSVQLVFSSDGSLQLIVNQDTNNTIKINKNGLGINGTPEEQLRVIGDQLIQGILTVLPGRIITEDIGSEIFFPGFTGEGFRIYKDDNGNYNAEFDNLTVRQTMRIYELILEKIRAVKGSMIISQGGEVIKSVEIVTKSVNELDVDAGTGEEYVNTGNQIEKQMYKIGFEEDYHVFKANDWIRSQVYDYGNVKGYWVWCRMVDTNYIYIDTDQFSEGVYPEIDDEIVQLGNSVDYYRQSAIYLSASDTVNPIIDILNNITGPSFSGCTRTRLGNLDGCTYGKTTLEGYGLFSDNAYLTGSLYVLGSNGETVDLKNQITNTINLKQVKNLRYFYSDAPNDYLAIRNGKYEILALYRDKTPQFIDHPDMKDPNYEFDPNNPDNPIGAYYDQWANYSYNRPGKTGDFYICYDGKSNPKIYVYNGSYVRTTTLAADDPLIYKEIELTSQDGRELPKLEIDAVTLAWNLVVALKIDGTERTVFLCDSYPNAQVEDGDYLIQPLTGKIYICLQSDVDGSEPAFWSESNISTVNIREEIALNLGYSDYSSLVSYAEQQNTIIRGGYINTYLLDAEIIIGNVIAGDYMKSNKIEIWNGTTAPTVAWRFDNTSITGGIVQTVDSEGVVLSEIYKVKFLPNGTLYGVKPGTDESDLYNNPWRFNEDGSGSLAFGNIRWDVNGKITFGDDVLGTTIDNGLITTGTIALGDGDDILNINSGITGSMTQDGITDENDLVRFWAGGTLEEAIQQVLAVKNTGDMSSLYAPYVVTQGGDLYANTGLIGGFSITSTGLRKDNMWLTNEGLYANRTVNSYQQKVYICTAGGLTEHPIATISAIGNYSFPNITTKDNIALAAYAPYKFGGVLGNNFAFYALGPSVFDSVYHTYDQRHAYGGDPVNTYDLTVDGKYTVYMVNVKNEIRLGAATAFMSLLQTKKLVFKFYIIQYANEEPEIKAQLSSVPVLGTEGTVKFRNQSMKTFFFDGYRFIPESDYRTG